MLKKKKNPLKHPSMVSYIVTCFMIQVPTVLLLKTCLNCYVYMFMIKDC
jgi:hypothetical protein